MKRTIQTIKHGEREFLKTFLPVLYYSGEINKGDYNEMLGYLDEFKGSNKIDRRAIKFLFDKRDALDRVTPRENEILTFENENGKLKMCYEYANNRLKSINYYGAVVEDEWYYESLPHNRGYTNWFFIKKLYPSSSRVHAHIKKFNEMARALQNIKFQVKCKSMC